MLLDDVTQRALAEQIADGGVAVINTPSLWVRFPQLPVCPSPPTTDYICALIDAGVGVPPRELVNGEEIPFFVVAYLGNELRVYPGVGTIEIDSTVQPRHVQAIAIPGVDEVNRAKWLGGHALQILTTPGALVENIVKDQASVN